MWHWEIFSPYFYLKKWLFCAAITISSVLSKNISNQRYVRNARNVCSLRGMLQGPMGLHDILTEHQPRLRRKARWTVDLIPLTPAAT